MNKNSSVGGQAVIEGVMMRGSKGIATAVRLCYIKCSGIYSL